MKDGSFGEMLQRWGGLKPLFMWIRGNTEPVLMMGNLRGRVGKNLDLDRSGLLLRLLWALIIWCGL